MRASWALTALASLASLCAAAAPPSPPSSPPSCDAVRPALLEAGLGQLHLLDRPEHGIGAGGACGCCGPTAAAKLSAQARDALENVVKVHARHTRADFVNNAKKYDALFLQLSEKSKRALHDMFTKTYGQIYESHAHLFSDLFDELEEYYTKGKLDLTKVMENFFSLLYKKMFTVINAQYHFDDKYLNCVSTHMKELQPFGDVPAKLTVQMKRSYVATRTFTHSLNAAGEIAKSIGNIKVPSWCEATKHCSLCNGIGEKPCTHLCLNVARACLPQYADLSLDWDAFVDAMDKVVERLLGSFNIVNVVDPINIKISEAIMNFQDQSPELSNRVFTGCGKPVLGVRPSDPNYFSHSRQTRSLRVNDDDFEIETSYESLLNKNPFILSRGKSRSDVSGEEMGSKENINIDISNENDYNNGFDVLKKIDKQYSSKTYDMLRFRREADPEPVPKRKEIDFETFNFNEDTRNRGSKKNKNKKQGGGTRKPTQTVDTLGAESEDELNKLMRQIKTVVSKTRNSWALLPYQYCHVESAAVSPNHGSDDKCWNGTHVGRYLLPLAGEGTSALATNPEVKGPSSNGAYSPTTSFVLEKQFDLRKLTNNLRNAYNGYEVHLDDDEESNQFYGSGSGSGSDDDDIDDPVDHDKSAEGSGGHHSTPDFVPAFEDITEKHFRPSVVINHPDVHEDDTKNIVGGFDPESENNHIDSSSEKDAGSISGVKKEEMSLQRALITYLFPIVCVWFGGIITDIA